MRAVSAVRPGLIRGDADEVTYGLHIILRFELERELLAGTVAVQRPAGRLERAHAASTSASKFRTTRTACCRTCTGRRGSSGISRPISSATSSRCRSGAARVSELGDLEEQFARGEFTVAARVAARADLPPREQISAAGAAAPRHRLGDRSRSVPRVSPREVRVKVCVIGAGAIGSLFAAHLAKVADVLRAHAAGGARAGAERARAAGERAARLHGAGHGGCRTARASGLRPRHHRDEGDGRGRGGRIASRPVPGRDDHDGPERARRGGDRASAREAGHSSPP